MSKPLFIPLNAEYFEEFEAGRKTREFRVYGPRWNERTCFPGRPVTLSYGYGKQRRIQGTVKSFFKVPAVSSSGTAALRKLTSKPFAFVAEIEIELTNER